MRLAVTCVCAAVIACVAGNYEVARFCAAVAFVWAGWRAAWSFVTATPQED